MLQKCFNENILQRNQQQYVEEEILVTSTGDKWVNQSKSIKIN